MKRFGIGQWCILGLLLAGLWTIACGSDDDDDDTIVNDDDIVDDDDTVLPDDDDTLPDDFQYEPGSGMPAWSNSRIDLVLSEIGGGDDPVYLAPVGWITVAGVDLPILRLFEAEDDSPAGIDIYGDIDDQGLLFGGVQTEPGLGNIDGGIGLLLDEPIAIGYDTPVGETREETIDGELTIGEPGVDPAIYLPLSLEYTVQDDNANAPSPAGPIPGCNAVDFRAGTRGIVLPKRLSQAIETAFGGEGTLWARRDIGFVHGILDLPPFGELFMGAGGCNAGFEQNGPFAQLIGVGQIAPCQSDYRLDTFDVFNRFDVNRTVFSGVRIEARWVDPVMAAGNEPPPVEILVNGENLELEPSELGLLFSSEWDDGFQFWLGKRELPAVQDAAPGNIEVTASLDPTATGEVRVGAVVEYILSDDPPDLNGLAPVLDCPLVATDCGECGDGVVDILEVCDGQTEEPCEDPDGAPGTRDCRDDCSGYTDCAPLAVCGNGVIEPGETCEVNDTEECVDQASGYAGLAACLDDCSGLAACVPSESCGDGMLNGNEECESGDTRGCLVDHEIPGLQPCTADCTWGACDTSSVCGDGRVTGLEVCDDNDTDNCTTGCNADCTGPYEVVCGDWKVECGEKCDDGDTDNCTPLCNADCSGPHQVICGDGVKECYEACDDGNTVSCDGCRMDCTRTERCGDGILECNEECDDGNTVGGDACTPECLNDTCGDGIAQPTEECDTELDPIYCDTDCTCMLGSMSSGLGYCY